MAVVSKDEAFSDAVTAWLREHDTALEVVLTATSWGDLLHAPEFPTDVVVLDAGSSRRNSIESRVRTIRAAGTTVIVMTAADSGDDVQHAVSSGAFCVLDKSVPMGLVAEMVRGAAGLPLRP
ncbi:hypothetical protein VD659_02395 [Herbiconiux sp. 11R-BC]|uniref:hypothetical protein n=1 Tax=Herbiconiux sp. 11R-BC TaxID=3111637 RepID=UPI003C121F6C